MKKLLQTDEGFIVLVLWVTLFTAIAVTMIDWGIKGALIKQAKELEERLDHEAKRLPDRNRLFGSDGVDHATGLEERKNHPQSEALFIPAETQD